MVLPHKPPLKHGQCEHSLIKFKRIARTAVEGYCSKCEEVIGVIITDPNPSRIKAYMSMSLRLEHIRQGKMITGKPRKLSYDERVNLK